MIKIALVSYLNTRPFIDGLSFHFQSGELDLALLSPADCARALLEGKCDMALLPVGALPDFQGIELMKDHCIGARGEVESVVLLGECPVEEMKDVVLDLHSRSSNVLARVLFRYHWKRSPEFLMPESRNFDQIRGSRGGVVIGDKAFRLREKFPYVYDLSQEWARLTGLPFVFAVWAYRPDRISRHQLGRVREALESGIRNVRSSAQKWGGTFGYSDEEAIHYLENCIDYRLDNAKHLALSQYFGYLKEFGQDVSIPSGLVSGKG